MTRFLSTKLAKTGFNLQACFALDDCPESIVQAIEKALPVELKNVELKKYQLLLFAHAGPGLWSEFQSWYAQSNNRELDDPLDSFSQSQVQNWLQQSSNVSDYYILYPWISSHADNTQRQQPLPVGLQELGELAGWHQDSLLKIGINPQWGTWFAYRVLVLAESSFPVTAVKTSSKSTKDLARSTEKNPRICQSCSEKPCVAACPAGAVNKPSDLSSESQFDLAACINFRLSKQSSCANTCLARMACPVAAEYRYPQTEINHHYRHSLSMIKRWRSS